MKACPRVLISAAMFALQFAAGPQLPAQTRAQAELPPVTVSGTATAAVEKSFRRMVQGMDLFNQLQPALAPGAALRFKLLPRKPATDMDHISLEVSGSSVDYEVPIAPDHTFELARDPRAFQENATVSTNRRRLSMTWRTEIRTPGWPAGSRRLGDLRLECRVGLEAGLVSNGDPLSRIAELFTTPEGYCGDPNSKYLFFAERPLFSITLISGSRSEVLPIDQLYAAASDDPGLKHDLPYCDCEVLIDRSYFLPLGDRSWPDDTRIEFEYMDAP